MLLIYAALSYVIGADVPEMAKGFFELTLVMSPIVAVVSCGFAAHGAASPDVEQLAVYGILALWLIATGRGLSRMRTAVRVSVDLPVV
jgi:hypothetical protein